MDGELGLLGVFDNPSAQPRSSRLFQIIFRTGYPLSIDLEMCCF